MFLFSTLAISDSTFLYVKEFLSYLDGCISARWDCHIYNLIILSGLLAASYVKYIDLGRTKSEAPVKKKINSCNAKRGGQCEKHQV